MRGTLSELLTVTVFECNLIKKLTIWEIVFPGFVFCQEFGLNQDCKTEPVIAKSQVCACKVTSLCLQSHKSVAAKSQACDCNVAKKARANAGKYNYSTRMIVVCAEPTEPYGGISVRGLSVSWSVWDLKGAVFKACDAIWQNQKKDFLCGGWSIGWFPRFFLLWGTNPQ